MTWLAFVLGYAGIVLCASTLAVHQRAFFRRSPPSSYVRGGRLGGVILLAASLLAAVAAFRWQVGVVAWTAMLAVGGFCLTQLLAFAPRFVLAPIGALLLPPIAVFIFP